MKGSYLPSGELTNISHQTGKGKSSSSKSTFGRGYVIVPRRVAKMMLEMLDVLDQI